MYPALTWAILPDAFSLALTVACWCTFGACPNIHVLKERPLEWLVCMQLCVYCTGFDLSFHLSQKLAFQHQIWPRYNILRACIACLELGRDTSETVVSPAPLEMLRDRGRLYCHLSLNYQAKFMPRRRHRALFLVHLTHKMWKPVVRRISAQLCEDSPHSCAKILCTAVRRFSAQLVVPTKSERWI